MGAMDELRKRFLLEFFIGHFLEMAKRCNGYRSYGQGLMYTMQADNMRGILVEMGYEGSQSEVNFGGQLRQLKEISDLNAMNEYLAMYYGSSHQLDKLLGIKRKISNQHSNPLPQIPSENVSEAQIHA